MTPHRPFVPENVSMKEFTLRAVMIGLVLCVVLGAANAYLGLKAGQTIAATYPAAVISMAAIRALKGSILEENIARTAGSIGESVAAGAAFTIPAFLLSGSWPDFEPSHVYWKSTALIIVGSILGVLFVSLVRRALVEDPTLPFPESLAAAEIHKAGRRGADAARFLFSSIGLGTLVQALVELSAYAGDKTFLVHVGQLGKSFVRLGGRASTNVLQTGAVSTVAGPTVSPALIGVGYVIGPELAALNFSGSVLAWGVLVPLIMYFLGPTLKNFLPPGSVNDGDWAAMAAAVWRYIVRPIAVGGMMVGAAYTLFRMGSKLTSSLGRAISEVRHGAPPLESMARTERYMGAKAVLSLIGVVFIAMIALYVNMAGWTAGVAAAIVMLIVGFFFATVSGNLCGVIGSSNNPISGLTLSTLIIAALLMVALGVSGPGGVAVVLGVAAVVCVSSAVAGELMQDFKAGYLLGGTPRSIQIVELIAVVVASLVMYYPLHLLQIGNIKTGGIGFGDPKLSAPQAGLMAALAQGIVGGDMAWPLVVAGALFGVFLIMIKVKSPMLVAIGMYLPFQTTCAIFVGGVLRWITDRQSAAAGNNEAQRTRVENIGILIASGLIAGEALTGLLFAYFKGKDIPIYAFFADPSYLAGLVVVAILGFIMVRVPLSKAGRADEPAPPAAMM